MDETPDRALANEATRHFTGLAVRLLFDFVADRLGVDEVATVLATVGERRSLASLTDDATWISYDEFRNLLVAASVAVGGLEGLRQIGTRSLSAAQSTAGT